MSELEKCPSCGSDPLLEAVRRARDERLADMITLALGVAVETHPESIRGALASVFDIRAVEAEAKRSMDLLYEIRRFASEAKALVGHVAKDIDALEKRIDGLSFALESAERFAAGKRGVSCGQTAHLPNGG